MRDEGRRMSYERGEVRYEGVGVGRWGDGGGCKY